jgi:hypothetical protein
MDFSVIKLFTHETIVHAQIIAVRKLLAREIKFDIMLNVRGIRSHIQFDASQTEINLLKDYSGYTVYVKTGNQWVPAL